MIEPADPTASAPSAATAFGGLNALWIRWGALLALTLSALHFISGLYLDSTYSKKEEVAAVRTLVYDRTRPIIDRVGGLENKLSGIETKLDERDKRETERAASQTAALEDIKRGQRDIEAFLRQPRR